ncbi:MAG: multidrug effflux MFS transporter [Opitutales bacterium]|nr:multidrug effflux MFS transporter [Opitutales bacterium]
MTVEKLKPSYNKKVLILVLGLISLFPPLATDMYLPAMIEMQSYFNAPDGGMGLTLSLFFLGLCLGQLIFGPIVDAYGRKKPLILGIIVYISSSLACLLVRRFELLVLLRFFQALGACSGMIIGRAIISDLFEGIEAAKIMSLIVVIMTLGPICSPVTGSLLLVLWNWSSIFYCMATIGLIALVMVLFSLPESLAPEKRNTEKMRSVFRRYFELLKNKEFLFLNVICAFIQSGMFAFITGSSHVFMEHYHLSSIQYGLCFGFVTLGLVLFAYINATILPKTGIHKLMNIAFFINLVSGFALISVSGSSHLWLLLIPLWFTIATIGGLGANAVTLAMDASKRRSGIGSALVGCFQFGFAFIVSALVSALQNDTVYPMSLCIALPGFISFALWIIYSKRIKPAM